MRVVQVGAYPPPYGGVTVHLMRLHEHLLREGLDSTLVDLSGAPPRAPGVVPLAWSEATRWLAEQPPAVVHFHNFAPGNAAAYARLAERHAAVLSLHNERFGDELDGLDPLRRRRALARLRRLHCVVVDNARCRSLAERLWRGRSEIRLIPEFIPARRVPPLGHPRILELRRRCRFLIAAGAWALSFHRGEDLYGLDLLVEALGRLVGERGLDAGLAFLLPQIGDADYLEEIRRRCAARGIASRVLFVTEPLEESVSLWRAADVVVRATNTDGSSLTVLEALSVGAPVVASDCVERPRGAVVFRSRDAADLERRLAEVLADLERHRAELRELSFDDNAAAFVALYGELERRRIACHA